MSKSTPCHALFQVYVYLQLSSVSKYFFPFKIAFSVSVHFALFTWSTLSPQSISLIAASFFYTQKSQRPAVCINKSTQIHRQVMSPGLGSRQPLLPSYIPSLPSPTLWGPESLWWVSLRVWFYEGASGNPVGLSLTPLESGAWDRPVTWLCLHQNGLTTSSWLGRWCFVACVLCGLRTTLSPNWSHWAMLWVYITTELLCWRWF